MRNLEAAREFFKNDIYATETTGIEIAEVREGYAKCTLRLDRRHRNAAGMVMGGALFTLADFAFAVASNEETAPSVSLTANIAYLSPARDGILTAEAACLKSGRRTCSYTVTITDEEGVTVAVLSETGLRLIEG